MPAGDTICPTCGVENGPFSKFCRACGSLLPSEQASPLSHLPSDDLPGSAALQEASPAQPKEIRLSMTVVEVEAVLGLPETRADLGEKVLYKYRNMTIEFHGGKVTDVR